MADEQTGTGALYEDLIDLDRLGVFKVLADSAYASKGDVPTKTSDLTNDSGYITASDVPAAPQATSTTPKMDGTAAVGTETKWAKGDHVHPTDTSRASASDLANLQTQVNNISVPQAATAAPKMDGTAAVGSSGKWAKEDHVHPTDTSRASATALSNLQTQVDAISVPEAATASPKMDGTAAVGSSAKWAKEDHVHPTDTSRAAASTVSALQTTVNGKADKATTLAGYGIADAYTKTEVDDKVDAITGVSYETVNALPATGQAGTIYLVPNSGTGTNGYDEYIWLASASRFEKIGTTEVDLSNYVQKTDITLATNAQVQALFA